MNDYYVYEYIRLDTNEPFYIGKGKDDRWKVLNRSCNKHFINIINSTPIAVNILHNNLNEEVAFGLEVYYIWLYRDIIGYDLVNIADGGEGSSGVFPSKETRKKMSESQKGDKNHFFGKHHSEETLEKISKANKGKNSWENMDEENRKERARRISEANKGREVSEEWKKKMSENHANVKRKNNPQALSVICLTTKKIFLCIKDAMDEYNIVGNSNIGNCCKGWKLVKGEKKTVKSAGKYKGVPLKWKYIKWNHNKKFRISK